MGDVTQGLPIAQEALTKAQAFYGEDTSHPVTALCLTTYGYHLKGMANTFNSTIQEAQVRRSGAAGRARDAMAGLLQGGGQLGGMHPVTALCLTTDGYVLKGNGNSFVKTIQEVQVGVGRVVVVVGLRGREGISHA